jgi:hypothetical protein
MWRDFRGAAVKTFNRLGMSVVVAAALSAMLPAPSSAATIYTYTGNPFNNVTGVYSNSDSVSGWFELASPLGGGTALTDITANVEAFAFTDGFQTLTTGVSINTLLIGTDIFGVPNVWNIDLIDDLTGAEITSCGVASDCGTVGRDTAFGANDVGAASVRDDPGSWSVSTTPLPAALPLFASGLGALGLLGWRRKRKVAALAA